MSVKGCIDKGLLRKADITGAEIENQLRISEDYIRKAGLVLGKDTFDISFLTAYISIFHSARGLLYSKGYRERSHFCLFEFIRTEYKDPEVIRLAEVAQNYRESRHLIQYEGSACSENMAKEAIIDAKRFLAAAKRSVKK
ncbi:MAG: HEPN domain-containing protein [Candidatus Micrarchaeota archaeon]